MKKIILLTVILLSCTSFTRLSAQMSCKDTVFNIDYTQNLCLSNFWGEWICDSMLDYNRHLSNDEIERTWTFDASLEFKCTYKSKALDDLERCKYKFIKGYLELDKCAAKSNSILTKITYKVIKFSTSRLEVQLNSAGGDNPEAAGFMIFHKK